jgi:periplasmic protein CpxP/Spy
MSYRPKQSRLLLCDHKIRALKAFLQYMFLLFPLNLYFFNTSNQQIFTINQKTMNKKLVLVLSIFTITFIVNIDSANAQAEGFQNVAQQEQTPEQRATKQVQRLTKALTLTNDQAAQIQPMLLELNQKRDAMRNASDKRAAMKDMRDLVTAQDEKMKTVLNSDQYTKYQDIKDEAKDRMRGKKGRRE